MSLNKQKGNMYDFVETWNPLAGECSHKCSYCYRNKMMRFPTIKKKYTGKPRLDDNAMKKNLGKGNYWFVCSMTDLFAADVPNDCIERILEYIRKYANNKYLLQTKNPESLLFWLAEVLSLDIVPCVTFETNRTMYQHFSGGQLFKDRLECLEVINVFFPFTMITIEPIIDFDLKEFVSMINKSSPNQVNIGADSGNNNLPEPSKEKTLELIKELKKFTKVHLKPNLNRLLK